MGRRSVIDKQTLERAILKPMRTFPHINKWHVRNEDWSANRWIAWTRILLERLTLRAPLFQRSHCVLRAPVSVTPGNTYVSRWSYVLQQFVPRICLAITHVLKNSGMQLDLRNGFGRLTVHTLEKRVFFRDRNTLRMAEGRGSSKRVPNPLERDPSPMGTLELPVQRVFARTTISSDIEQVVERQVGASPILAEICNHAVRRVLEKSERIEERRMQSLVLRREMRTVVGSDSDSRQKEIIATSPWGASVGKSGFAITNGPMSIDLNRLTDQVVQQIDSRISAYRERMGKVF